MDNKRSSNGGNDSSGKANLKSAKLFNNNAILVTNGSIKDYGFIYRTLVKTFQSLDDTFVIAADGGASHCSNLRITPNVIIGDMDSITKGMIEKLGGLSGGNNVTSSGAAGNIGSTAGSKSSGTGGSSGTGLGAGWSSSTSGSRTTGGTAGDKGSSTGGSSSAATGEIQFISFSQAKDESDTQLALDYLVKNGYERIIVIGAFGSRADHSYANLSLLSSPAYDNVKVSIITENSEIFVLKNSCTIKGEVGKKISLFSLTPFTFFEKTSGLKYKLKNEKLLFSPARGLSNEFTKDSAKLDITEGWLLVIREL